MLDPVPHQVVFHKGFFAIEIVHVNMGVQSVVTSTKGNALGAGPEGQVLAPVACGWAAKQWHQLCCSRGNLLASRTLFADWFCKFGIPAQIHTDGGKEFVNKLSLDKNA